MTRIRIPTGSAKSTVVKPKVQHTFAEALDRTVARDYFSSFGYYAFYTKFRDFSLRQSDLLFAPNHFETKKPEHERKQKESFRKKFIKTFSLKVKGSL